MKIHPHLPPQAFGRTTDAPPAERQAYAAASPTTTEPVDTVELGDAEPDLGDHQPGVIRNLLSGHYGGVADVRLRIVHADRLAALQDQAAADAAQTGSAALGEAVASNVETLLGRDDLTDEQRAGVQAAVEAFNVALADEESDPAAAADQLLDELDSLLLAAPEEPVAPVVDPVDAGEDVALIGVEEPADVTDDAEPAPSDVPTLADVLLAFRAAVDQVLADTEQAIASSDPLPPLSEPRGNGGAYAKFLEQYLRMQGDASDDATDGEATPVDSPVDVTA